MTSPPHPTVERRLLGSKQRSWDIFHSNGEEETLVTAQKTILALAEGAGVIKQDLSHCPGSPRWLKTVKISIFGNFEITSVLLDGHVIYWWNYNIWLYRLRHRNLCDKTEVLLHATFRYNLNPHCHVATTPYLTTWHKGKSRKPWPRYHEQNVLQVVAIITLSIFSFQDVNN